MLKALLGIGDDHREAKHSAGLVVDALLGKKGARLTPEQAQERTVYALTLLC